MLELGISQAQAQFTKILTKSVIIVDKKAHQKKAVILPYEEYINLLAKVTKKEDLEKGIFNQFIGILDKDFQEKDTKYQEILK